MRVCMSTKFWKFFTIYRVLMNTYYKLIGVVTETFCLTSLKKLK